MDEAARALPETSSLTPVELRRGASAEGEAALASSLENAPMARPTRN
jgi:hypothetical protein